MEKCKRLFLISFYILSITAAAELVSSYALKTKDEGFQSGIAGIVEKALWRFNGQSRQMVSLNRETGKPTQIIRRDAILGYTYQPGPHVITLKDGNAKTSHTFTLTVDDQGRRITSFLPVAGEKTVQIMGDSVASGWINDDVISFPFLLQALAPDWRVSNLAVAGYGPVQAYLQAQSLAERREKVDAFLITYADYFPMRAIGDSANFASLRRAPAISGPEMADDLQTLKLPVVRRLTTDGRPVIDYVSIEDGARDGEEAAKISPEQQLSIVERLYSGVKEAFPESTVAILYTHGNATPQTLELFADLRRTGISVCDARPVSKMDQDDFSPLDGHPGPKTQNWFAKVADNFLRTGQCLQPE